jgi:hypothetical protein
MRSSMARRSAYRADTHHQQMQQSRHLQCWLTSQNWLRFHLQWEHRHTCGACRETKFDQPLQLRGSSSLYQAWSSSREILKFHRAHLPRVCNLRTMETQCCNRTWLEKLHCQKLHLGKRLDSVTQIAPCSDQLNFHSSKAQFQELEPRLRL